MAALCAGPAFAVGRDAARIEITDEVISRWDVSRERLQAERGLGARLLALEAARLRQLAKLRSLEPERWNSPQYLTPRQRLTPAALALIGEAEPSLAVEPAASRIASGSGDGLFLKEAVEKLDAARMEAGCAFDGGCASSAPAVVEARMTPASAGKGAPAAAASSSRARSAEPPPPSGVQSLVRELARETEDAWEDVSAELPKSGHRYGVLGKLSNAFRLRGIESKLRSDDPDDVKQAVKLGRKLFHVADGVEPAFFDNMIEKGLLRTLVTFSKEVRRQHPDTTAEDTFQAGRNVWTANALQTLWNLPVKVTDSVLGYSMLYPYSDNILDGPASPEEKKGFAARFRTRLEGRAIEPAGVMEKKIFDMVARIEKEWSRKDAPKVYDSLLAIHDAQVRSIKAQGNDLSYEDVVSIQVEKGGTSVLADGYLVKGDMTPQESRFSFMLGYALQLLDDLQDIGDDLGNGHLSVFTCALRHDMALDYLVSRLWNFLEVAIGPGKEKTAPVHKAMVDVCRILIVESVARYSDFFTPGYLKKMAKLAPIPFKYIHEMSLEHRIFNMLTGERLPVARARDISLTLEWIAHLLGKDTPARTQDDAKRRLNLRSWLRLDQTYYRSPDAGNGKERS